ncbi:MAG: phosphate regulon sensor histidine kinase PhoR [Gammaproteobacteria bacterium]|nr:MAG: phosphate regulon sensor histidine kinase PhoR [Gammaproteobacteria bacterium]RKZ75351.1 MAG: phosphate regulon sensor histidine kinase PhoR [Gammaproteobacteria bacterium]
MSEPWSVESWRIGAILIALFVIWGLTGNWLLAILLPLIIYISWLMYQLYCLERWLSSGLKSGEAPDMNGVWGLIIQHIYRQKQLEKKHKKKFKGLLKRFNSVVSVFPDAAIVLNQHKEIEWSNKAAKKLLGIENIRDRGQHIGNLIRVPAFQHCLQSKNNDCTLELNYPSQSHTVLRLILFGKGQYLLTACDISQQINLQRMREAFIANASHELRTPLTVIAGYLEIMESHPDVPENLHEPIISALSQANRMGQIIEDLLTLSRLETTTHLSKQSGTVVDVSLILANIVSDIQKTVAMDSHILHLDTDSTLKIRAVESEIDSVCLNLIKNAVKHTPAGTTVQIRWFLNETGQACLEVIDNGKGVPAKEIPCLTERFYRVNVGRSRQVGGTGLGLAIVKHIMERHQGYLLISSQADIKTQFIACFPVYRVYCTRA